MQRRSFLAAMPGDAGRVAMRAHIMVDREARLKPELLQRLRT
jgi:hypothetical protein